MAKQVVFRADASAEIGGGHVMRCLTLAQALQTIGWKCAFATSSDSLAIIPSLSTSGADLLELPDDADDEAAVLATHWPGGCTLLVVDHYRRDAKFERACRPWAHSIMIIDDLANRLHESDILLDQTYGQTENAYADKVPEKCRLLLGTTYALLRPEFSRAREASLERRKNSGRGLRILVSLGATDPGCVTDIVLDGIVMSGVDAAVDIVLGANAPHQESVRKRTASLGMEAKLHVATSDIAGLMAAADIAVGAAGTTSWERCSLGLPTLLVTTADNQKYVADALDKAGAVQLLGAAEELTPERVAGSLKRLAADSEQLCRMSQCAAAVCDGRGSERVILDLATALAQNPQSIHLRMASSEDNELLHDWQNHPLTRRYARKPEAPTLAEHREWMEQTLSDPEKMLIIVMERDDPVGVLRLDALEDSQVRVISIYIAPRKHGRGIGTAILALAREIFPSWEFRAHVLPDNHASHSLFRRAGYLQLQDTQYVLRPVAGELN